MSTTTEHIAHFAWDMPFYGEMTADKFSTRFAASLAEVEFQAQSRTQQLDWPTLTITYEGPLAPRGAGDLGVDHMYRITVDAA